MQDSFLVDVIRFLLDGNLKYNVNYKTSIYITISLLDTNVKSLLTLTVGSDEILIKKTKTFPMLNFQGIFFRLIGGTRGVTVGVHSFTYVQILNESVCISHLWVDCVLYIATNLEERKFWIQTV